MLARQGRRRLVPRSCHTEVIARQYLFVTTVVCVPKKVVYETWFCDAENWGRSTTETVTGEVEAARRVGGQCGVGRSVLNYQILRII